ncbi:MAG: HAD family hydrolase [Enterocloster sp.]
MPDSWKGFKKKKDVLICVDSDGCAMDTMDSKHINCFGPCLIPVWGLEPWKDQILKRWNEINLYTMTRGINRFKALAVILAEVQEKYRPIPGLEQFSRWTEETSELSGDSIRAAWEQTGNPIFRQAMEWSQEVNRQIGQMPQDEKKAFPGVREALAKAHQYADVAVVSSANRQAVLEEWDNQKLLPFVDLVLSQDAGTKAECIRGLLELGYRKEMALMVGDAPGDCQAASENGVYYYPILVKHEKESWDSFAEEAVDRLLKGTYGGEYQDKKTEEFKKNLNS